MWYVVISLSLLLLGVFLIKKEKNSFVNGSVFTLGLFLTVFSLIYQISIYIDTVNSRIENITSFLIYIVVLTIALSVIFILVYSSFLMIKNEGRNPTVFMGLCLLFNFIFILAYPIILDQLFLYNVSNVIQIIFISLWFLDMVLTFLFILYLFYSVFHQMKKKDGPIDYIITLGSGITSEEVTPLLKSRLDKGIEYYRKNPKSTFIVSGGQGFDEPVSEAYAMSRYLYSKGIPEEQVILEDMSTTTYENMKFSKNKIVEHLNNSKTIEDMTIIFTTNNYHVFRASLYANKAKLKAEGIGAPTAHYFLPNALIREFFAILVMHKYQILILLILSIGFVLFNL